MAKISGKVKNRLKLIKAGYTNDSVVMGEYLASESANDLTLEEAHELYMLAQSYANGDKFYTILGNNPGYFINCLDDSDVVIDFS